MDKDWYRPSVDKLLPVFICGRCELASRPIDLGSRGGVDRAPHHTRMCHVEQSPGSISLHPHILRFSKSGQRAQSARLGDLCLVLLMRRQVRDASDSVALDFDVGRAHLVDEGAQSPEGHDLDLVLGWVARRVSSFAPSICTGRAYVGIWDGFQASPLTARLPRAALAARWTSRSSLARRNSIGWSVSRSTSRTSRETATALVQRRTSTRQSSLVSGEICREDGTHLVL